MSQVAQMTLKININKASISDLLTKLNHCRTGRGRAIGPKLAERIIQYRQEKGIFRHINDLLKVDMVGPKTLMAIQDFICV